MFKSMQRTRKQDAIIGLFFTVLGIFCWINTKDLGEDVNAFTHIVLAADIALGVILMIMSFIKKDVKQGEEVFAKDFKTPLIAAGILTLYVILMKVLGFYSSSILFMLGFGYWMGYRKWIPLVATTAGMLTFVYILFNMTLHVGFPNGLLF